MSDLVEVALDAGERLLERGVLIVLQVRRSATGRRISLGVGLLDAADSVLFAAAASRMLRRKRTGATSPRSPQTPSGSLPRNPRSAP